MSRMSVGILRGGASKGYASSLRSGATILQSLPEEHYDARDIFIDHLGVWHLRGIPVSPVRALSGLDVVINALYNDGIGADGDVARVLKQSAIPYTGTRGTTASLVRNRTWMRRALSDIGIKMPRAHALSGRKEMDTGEMARQIFMEFGPPYLVKPASGGAAIDLRVAATIHDLPDVLADMLEEYDTLLVEEFMRGDHVSVGVIENFRNEEFYTLPPAQFVLPEGIIIPDIKVRMENTAMHTCPWNSGLDNKKILMSAARNAHTKLGLSHYSRSDFVTKGSSVYLVSVNAFPELYGGSAFASMLDTVGATLPQFLEHIIESARR